MSDTSKLEWDEQPKKEINDAVPEKTNKKGLLNLIGAILLCLAVVGIIVLIRSSGDTKSPEIQENKTQETVAKNQEQAKTDKEDVKKEQEIKQSLQTFISSNYKGWQIAGKGLINYDEENNIAEYNLDLVSGNKNKIITVAVEKFEKDDGDDFWLAFQPSEFQQLDMQIKSVKSKVAEIEQKDEADAAKDNENSNP